MGEMTARAAREAGFAARSADGDVESLAALAAREPAGPGVWLHVRGREAAGDLTGRLKAAGVPARGLEIYRQVSLPMPGPAAALLAEGGVPVIAAFSPRSARRRLLLRLRRRAWIEYTDERSGRARRSLPARLCALPCVGVRAMRRLALDARLLRFFAADTRLARSAALAGTSVALVATAWPTTPTTRAECTEPRFDARSASP